MLQRLPKFLKVAQMTASFPKVAEQLVDRATNQVSDPGGDFYWYVMGGQALDIFEKPKNILDLGHLKPQNILIASQYMKTKGFTGIFGNYPAIFC